MSQIPNIKWRTPFLHTIDELYSNFPCSILLQLYFIVPKIRKNSINHQYKLKSGFEDNSAFVVNKFKKFFALNFFKILYPVIVS